MWAYLCFIMTAAWAVLEEAAVCSCYLSFPVSFCSHASEHLPLQTHLQPLISSLKTMGILMPMLTNGSFIHSCTPTALFDSSLHLAAVAGGGFWILSTYAEQKDSSYLQRIGLVDSGASLEHSAEWCEERHLGYCTI